jgi:hypothetical protein
MKQIQPVVFPLNLGTATILSCIGQDNFSTSVIIYYQLLSAENQILQSGNLSLSGADYEAYNSSADGNQYIYEWSATQLGVVIIGDYVPPVPEPIVPEVVAEVTE